MDCTIKFLPYWLQHKLLEFLRSVQTMIYGDGLEVPTWPFAESILICFSPGTESVFDRLCDDQSISFQSLLNGIECLPMPPSQRIAIAKLLSSCQPKVLWLTSLTMHNYHCSLCCWTVRRTFVLVRQKPLFSVFNKTKGTFSPCCRFSTICFTKLINFPVFLLLDIHALIHFTASNTSFKSGETWTPFCMPHLNSRAFLNVYICYLNENLCMALISPSRDSFFDCSNMAKSFLEVIQL